MAYSDYAQAASDNKDSIKWGTILTITGITAVTITALIVAWKSGALNKLTPDVSNPLGLRPSGSTSQGQPSAGSQGQASGGMGLPGLGGGLPGLGGGLIPGMGGGGGMGIPGLGIPGLF